MPVVEHRLGAPWTALAFVVAAAAGCAAPCPEAWTADGAGNCLEPAPAVVPGDDDDDSTPLDPCAEPFDASTIPGPLNAYPGDLHLYNRADLEWFCSEWDGVAGALEIGGTEAPGGEDVENDIVDLSALDCLVDVSNYFFVGHNAGLERFELPALRQVGRPGSGSLSVVLNDGMQRLVAPLLQSIGGDLSVQNNPTLDRLELPALRAVGVNVYLAGNSSLSTSDAEDLVAGICPERIGGSINIVGNAPD